MTEASELEKEINFSELEKQTIMLTFFSNLDRDIYTIRNLPQEFTAVLKAYYSRDPHSLRENFWTVITDKDLGIADRIREEIDQGQKPRVAAWLATEDMLESEVIRKFHETYTIGFGHGSVAEHATASFAVENCSIPLTKELEDQRLASYTEKSTRYQKFSRETVYIPPCFEQRPDIKAAYLNAVGKLFDIYEEAGPILEERIKKENPNMKKKDRENALFDIIRYLLPAGIKTSVGPTMNGRVAAKAIRKMASSKLEESRIAAEQIKQEIQKELPTLVKHCEPSDYLIRNRENLEELAQKATADMDVPQNGPTTRLVHHEHEVTAMQKIIAFLLYANSPKPVPYDVIYERVEEMSRDEQKAIIDSINKDRKRHDQLPRAFETVDYVWETVIDYGAYRDIQRQRMCTQATTGLVPGLGFTIPQELIDAGFGDRINKVFAECERKYHLIAKHFPAEAQYVMPLATNVRVLFKMNLRELDEVMPLRTGPGTHASYRSKILDLTAEVRRVHPYLGSLLRTGKVD